MPSFCQIFLLHIFFYFQFNNSNFKYLILSSTNSTGSSNSVLFWVSQNVLENHMSLLGKPITYELVCSFARSSITTFCRQATDIHFFYPLTIIAGWLSTGMDRSRRRYFNKINLNLSPRLNRWLNDATISSLLSLTESTVSGRVLSRITNSVLLEPFLDISIKLTRHFHWSWENPLLPYPLI